MTWASRVDEEFSRIVGNNLPSRSFEAAERIFNFVVDSYVLDVSRSMSLLMAGVLATWFTIHFIVLGFSILRGEVQDPMNAIVKDVFRISIVLVVGSTAGAYNSIVIGGVNSLEAMLVSGMSNSDAQSVGTAVGRLFDPGLVVVDGKRYSAAGAMFASAMKHGYGPFPDIGFLYAGLMMAIGQGIVVAFLIIPFFLAKTYLALLCAIGPVAIYMLISPVTKQYFQNWLAATIAQVLILGFVAALATMLSTIFLSFLRYSLSNVTIDFNAVDVGTVIFILALALAVVALNISNFSSQLSGGGSVSDGKGLVATMVQMVVTRALFKGMVPSKPATPPTPGGTMANGAPTQNQSTMGRNVGFAVGRGASTLLNNLKGR